MASPPFYYNIACESGPRIAPLKVTASLHVSLIKCFSHSICPSPLDPSFSARYHWSSVEGTLFSSPQFGIHCPQGFSPPCSDYALRIDFQFCKLFTTFSTFPKRQALVLSLPILSFSAPVGLNLSSLVGNSWPGGFFWIFWFFFF